MTVIDVIQNVEYRTIKIHEIYSARKICSDMETCQIRISPVQFKALLGHSTLLVRRNQHLSVGDRPLKQSS